MTIRFTPLPYPGDALEPCISARTLEAHHGHHHAGYVATANALLADSSLPWTGLADLVDAAALLPDPALFNAASQVWNHEFYWRSLRPGGGPARGEIAARIDAEFGSQAAFSEAFTAAAVGLFGSGWTWLVLAGDRLRITATPDAHSPRGAGEVPLLVLDVWEHAYYLDHAYRRADSVRGCLEKLMNWEFASANLALGRRCQSPAQGDG